MLWGSILHIILCVVVVHRDFNPAQWRGPIFCQKGQIIFNSQYFYDFWYCWTVNYGNSMAGILPRKDKNELFVWVAHITTSYSIKTTLYYGLLRKNWDTPWKCLPSPHQNLGYFFSKMLKKHFKAIKWNL